MLYTPGRSLSWPLFRLPPPSGLQPIESVATPATCLGRGRGAANVDSHIRLSGFPRKSRLIWVEASRRFMRLGLGPWCFGHRRSWVSRYDEATGGSSFEVAGTVMNDCRGGREDGRCDACGQRCDELIRCSYCRRWFCARCFYRYDVPPARCDKCSEFLPLARIIARRCRRRRRHATRDRVRSGEDESAGAGLVGADIEAAGANPGPAGGTPELPATRARICDELVGGVQRAAAFPDQERGRVPSDPRPRRRR
jgi:hypothetical protein